MKFLFKNTTTLTESEIESTLKSLEAYHNKIIEVLKSDDYVFSECTLNLPKDEQVLREVMEMVSQKKTTDLKYVVVIGIGGSNLGTKAVYDALYGFYEVYEGNRFPKIIFLDTQDEVALEKCVSLLSKCSKKTEFVINAISKSGSTTETMVNLEVLYNSLKNVFGDLNDRMVFTTVSDSKMHLQAEKNNISTLFMPNMVGGRYSVFSNVGMFPLALAGMNIKKLRLGAEKLRELFGKNTVDISNAPAVSASVLYLLNKKGFTISDTFTFVPQLESFGKWYRQLMGESIGKNSKGITPTVSSGSVDLHSVAQLYLDGPNDKITTFISLDKPQNKIKVSEELSFPIIDVIKDRSVYDVMSAIVNGTKKTYENLKRPFMSIQIDNVDEEGLGYLLQFKMIEMMYLGKLLNVNTFDQPAVELYKVEVKKILGA
jgi:glucose-6-phosphate isomerase